MSNPTVRFIVHDHKAIKAGLHQDLRFQYPKNLRIWYSFAVPKNIPLVPGIKVLAIRTHDHTEEEALYKGDIPASEYGGGTLTVFDQGLVRIEKLTSAHIALYFQGAKVKGLYHLISVGNVDQKQYKAQHYMMFKSKMKIDEPLSLDMKKSEIQNILRISSKFKDH